MAKRGSECPNSLFRDLVGELRIIVQIRSDRHVAGQITILVDIAHVHGLLLLSELSFQVSCTKRQ